MQRPCFALAMLLGSMASSLLLVGTVNSETSVGTVASLPEPATVCECPEEMSTQWVVLGQSVEDESDGGSDGWSQSLGTGYDADYDFAMHDGCYDDVPRSKPDIEHAFAAGEHPVGGSDAALSPNGFTRWTPDQEIHYLFVVAIEEDVVEQLPSRKRHTALLLEQIHLARDWTNQVWRNWWNDTKDQTWVIALRDQWSETQAEISREDALHYGAFDIHAGIGGGAAGELSGDDRCDEGSFEGQPSTASTEEYRDEVVLITAADTLDRIGSRLQEAAQYLRSLAAERIVAKGSSRRVAQKLID